MADVESLKKNWLRPFFFYGNNRISLIGGALTSASALILVGIYRRQKSLQAAGQVPSIYPDVDLRDPAFRHGIDFVVVATFINFVIVGTASYRGVAYMDTPSFCGTSCPVM